MAYQQDVIEETWHQIISQSHVLLLQREIPEAINILAAKCAKENGVTVVLDMGGRDDLISDEMISLCDIISPNETETQRLFSASRVDTESCKGEGD